MIIRRIFLLIVIVSLITFNCSIVWAKEPAMPEFTMSQAVKKAKQNNKSLTAANYDIDRGLEVRDFAADKVLYTPIGPTREPDFRVYTGLVQADISWRMAERLYKMQEDTVVMQTYQAYDGLLQALENVGVADAKLKSASSQHVVAQTSYRVGILSKMSLIQADAALISAKAGTQASKKALEDAYQKFNQLVGLWPEDRPVLMDTPKFIELKVEDLNYEVEKTVEESPSVWLSQKKVDIAKLTLDLYDFADANRQEPYDAKEIDVSKAEISAADTKEQLRKLVRTLYYTAKQLEEQYAIAQENVKVNEESLRVMRIKYEVGMATISQVNEAETALAKAKQAVLDLACQHEILSYAFRNPWAYTGAASGSLS